MLSRWNEKTLSRITGYTRMNFTFVDGTGGGETLATNDAITKMLIGLDEKRTFSAFVNALPRLGVDGSLAFVTDFRSDPTLAGATGQVAAEPGTWAKSINAGVVLKGQAFGGYITTKRGKRLTY